MNEVMNRGWKMRQVKVKTSTLLAKLQENLVKHIADFKEAQAGYVTQAKAALQERASVLETGKIVSLTFDLEPPVSHEKSYDVVIQMLEMSVEEETILSTDEFQCYVMDDWQWKESFRNTVMNYSSGR